MANCCGLLHSNLKKDIWLHPDDELSWHAHRCTDGLCGLPLCARLWPYCTRVSTCITVSPPNPNAEADLVSGGHPRGITSVT